MPNAKLPAKHRAIVLHGYDTPAQLETLPTPQPGPGAVVVRVLAVPVVSYIHEVYSGKRPEYRMPHPFVPGFGAICRVAAVSPTVTTLQVGQLVCFDSVMSPRDNKDALWVQGVSAIGDVGAKYSMGEFRNGTFAEYARLPEENLFPLDELRLLGSLSDGGLRYTVEDLAQIILLLTLIGGIDDIGLQPGETAIVAPATGGFSSAAVRIAAALGAHVVAFSRNEDELRKLQALSKLITAVKNTGNIDADTEAIKTAARGEVDVYIDVSPPAAASSTHFQSCLKALRFRGRISLIGGIRGDKPAWSYEELFNKNVTLKGTTQCTPEQTRRLIKLVTTGVMPLGKEGGCEVVATFGLEDFAKALNTAEQHPGSGQMVVITP
ncbi:Acryloyl-coenzyme A reductase [Paramyrothecium foliicola]|nr:Acryloyl-coenzyme A reductase [Paramyrothecium foliicola]